MTGGPAGRTGTIPPENHAPGPRGPSAGRGLQVIRLAALRATARVVPASPAEFAVLQRQRAAVKRLLLAELDPLLRPLGYARAGATWRKTGAFARSELQIQASRYGFDCFVNAAAGWRWCPQWPKYHRLARFCPELANQAPDALPYARLHDDPAYRDAIVTVIRARMIPWMEAAHGLAGLIGRPAPGDMRRTRIFEDA